MTRSDLGSQAAREAAMRDHNGEVRRSAAPALDPATLGAEVAALEHLRTHGAAGFASLSRAQAEALLGRLMQPVEGVAEASAPYRRRRTRLSSWDALLSYAHERFADRKTEAVCVFFLDRKNQLIADEIVGEGTVDQAPVYPREIVRRALELGASALILAHNHPSGDPSPSTADVQITRQVADAARVLGIVVHDHIVVGRYGVASLKSLGLI